MIADKFAVHVRAALVALALAVMVSPAQAQKPSGQKPSAAAFALAMEVLNLKGGDKMFSPLVPGIITNVKNIILQSNLNLSKELDEVALKLAGEYNPRLDELTRHSAQLFASHFTEKELAQVVAFYKSPLGKKVIEAEPKVLEQSMAHADAWARNMEQEILERFRAEMKKKGHDI